jgi:hypothetical protein
VDVHDAFHVSQLKKCLRVPKEKLPIEKLSVQDDLTYTEYPIKILDTLARVTRNKVQWSHHSKDEATWEREEELRVEFPHLFPSSRHENGFGIFRNFRNRFWIFSIGFIGNGIFQNRYRLSKL